MQMTTVNDVPATSTTCAECGRSVDAAAVIPAIDRPGVRCADFEACHDRKEARSAFAA
jgi:hypothetical protein